MWDEHNPEPKLSDSGAPFTSQKLVRDLLSSQPAPQDQVPGIESLTMGLLHLPLTHSALDRSAIRRMEPRLTEELLADEHTWILPIYDREVPVQPGPTLHLDLIAPSRVPAYLRHHEETMWVYLGELDERQVLALILPTTVGTTTTAQWRGQFVWQTLRGLAEHVAHREVYAETAARAELAMVGVALANWHVTARFCGRCGSRTRITSEGWSRTCTGCEVEHFPRTDPAVIMAVISPQDELLLGNSAKWGPNRFSTLAGFVEPGETLEEAVRREVLEESAIVVDKATYLASQPWPFPGSLMLGYFAYATTTDITVDGVEVRAARWFTRAQLAHEVAQGLIELPGVSSIARRLIEHWYGEPLHAPATD